MVYVIGILLVIIALFIISSIWRKRIYDAVDKLESWKIDIMDRDVAIQLSKIKSLNLLGETLEKFEDWKSRWDNIITKELLEVEEYLFDAEEAADRYRFNKAKKVVHETEQQLTSIEKDIEEILFDLTQLLESEEASREEVTHVEPTLKALKRQLSQQRYQYGKAEVEFDHQLNQLMKDVESYYELIEEGDYVKAKKCVDVIAEELEELRVKMEEFPTVYKKQRHEIPNQIEELKRGMIEMIDDGYRINHLDFDKEIKQYEERLNALTSQLDKGEINQVKQLLVEIEERMKDMYDALEKEAIAKSYLESQLPSYEQVIRVIEEAFTETKLEVEQMKSAYYFEDSDLEQYLTLEKSIIQLRNQLKEIQNEMDEEDKAHSDIRNELEEGFLHTQNLKDQHEAFKKRIYNLRSDEIEAKEKLLEMSEEINQMRRKLKKNNLPGVPTYIWTFIEQAVAKNNYVISTLEKQPLDISQVQEKLDASRQAIEHAMQQIDVMIDQAKLTEEVIQYANRYRGRHATLREEILESERLFRKFEYELALEKAAKAVEQVEPGALKKIEMNQIH